MLLVFVVIYWWQIGSGQHYPCPRMICHALIIGYNDLHYWKLPAIDDKILWEGSLNILSHGHSREIMRRSAFSHFCRKMINFAGVYH